MKIIEYAVRDIDQFGDVIDVDFHDSKIKAMAAAKVAMHTINGPAAVVVERETKWGNDADGITDIERETVFHGGSVAALAAGGWIEM